MSKIKAGEVMPLRYSFTKYVEIYPVVHSQIIDTVSYDLGARIGSTGKGFTDKWFYNLIVPKSFPPGRYHITRTFVFHLNPLRTVSYKLTSDEFEVIK